MTGNRRQCLAAAAAGATMAALAFGGTVAQARSTSGSGATSTPAGNDVSSPQCSSALPRHSTFGIVGVNDGIAWSQNPCLGSEYAWARALAGSPAFYMNTANPAPHSSHYWPQSQTSDPALCKDATTVDDPGCAYDYGWHTAADALATASRVTSSADALGHTWWLDVEIANTWNGTSSANAADLQGSIDYLRSRGVPTVGIYSTSYQWGQITGGYSVATQASYAQAWAPEFTSPSGIGRSPDWVAGAPGSRQAPAYCKQSFTGVAVRLVQYPSGGFDADYSCPGQ